MPLRKKKNTHIRTIIFLAAAAAVVLLMIISFPPVSNLTEIVVYP